MIYIVRKNLDKFRRMIKVVGNYLICFNIIVYCNKLRNSFYICYLFLRKVTLRGVVLFIKKRMLDIGLIRVLLLIR